MTLSLCMIARDEQAMIGAALASVRGAVDEMIVLDTGSTDATAQIAAECGAEVVTWPWRDDFAQARNESLRHANGDWVLVMDADERLASSSKAALRRFTEQTDKVCGMARLHDASALEAPEDHVLSGSARIGKPMRVPRVLRRDQDLRFHGVVHETVRPWLVEHAGGVVPVAVDLVHFGAIPAIRSARNKSSRNVSMLCRRLEIDGDDFTVHGYLAHEYLALKQHEQAWEVAEQGWKLLDQTDRASCKSVIRLAVARMIMQLRRGDAIGLLDTVRGAERYEGAHPDLDFFRGQAAEMLAVTETNEVVQRRFLEEAERAYRSCVRRHDHAVVQCFVLGADGWHAHLRLGAVYVMAGAVAEAKASFARAREERPELVPARWGAAEVSLLEGDADGALELLEGATGDRPEGRILAAAAHYQAGNAARALRLLSEVPEVRDGYDEPRLLHLRSWLERRLGP